MKAAAGVVCAAILTVACGGGAGSKPVPDAPASAPATTGSTASTAPSAAPGPATTASTAPAASSPSNVERPLATTAAEATLRIDEAVSSRSKEIGHCVTEARARRNNPHAEVLVEIGIDQEGQLIGVKSPKGAPDAKLHDCVRDALRGAAFPRSKAGVITIRKNFSDQVFYP